MKVKFAVAILGNFQWSLDYNARPYLESSITL